MKIEAVFGGFLVLIVLAVALYALISTNIVSSPSQSGETTSVGGGPIVVEATSPVCQCFHKAFKLAGSNVGVMSSQYRTGFEACQGQFGAQGGDAWTAGWNARLSAKPYEASCRAWLGRRS
ncbi:MAG: hypothetical protein GC153_00860 [Alphaproteobacteria bacterium]|nr:hypothetical protein [Alphaproteobacteria bacterium]